MKTISKEIKLCMVCMEEHEVIIVEVEETTEFKKETVTFPAIYEYCPLTDILSETEDLMQKNDLKMKDTYRKQTKLLSSSEIIDIRQAYGISQKDFSTILDWGGATIARYESHQVQDNAHDEVLRRASEDPRWFLEKLDQSKSKLSEKTFRKYYEKVLHRLSQQSDYYMRLAITAQYAQYQSIEESGNQQLNLDKVVEMINYFATKVDRVYRVKLMKFLWYSDTLSFHRRHHSISGLVYRALPLGAVPVSHEQILSLKGINQRNETDDKGNLAYRILPDTDVKIRTLSQEDLSILDLVIEEFGELKSVPLVERMHAEEAFSLVKENEVIPYDSSVDFSIKG